MAHNPNYFIDNDITPAGTYHGFEYALVDSPCDTKNGYVRVPDDVCTQLFAKFDVPSHADQYYSDVITTVTEDYDRFEDLLYTIATTYANNIYLLNLHHKTWLTYGDSQGWIGFDTCHAGDAWLDDNNTLRPVVPYMKSNDDGIEYVTTNNNSDNGDNNIDIAQPITNDMMGDITTVWNEQEVINECKRIIDILRLGLAYKN